MEQEIQKISLNDLTENKVYKLFGLRRVTHLSALDEWLQKEILVSDQERLVVKIFQDRLLQNIDSWNEQELSLGFIGPILNLINFKIPYRMNFFAQRSISSTIGEYYLNGKPDSIISSGHFEPEAPFFCFQEFKKEKETSGDPIGQNLGAMLIGQNENEGRFPIYGCYVIGRHWFFMVLQGTEYAISKS
ncbi:MAG: hypothetical protein AAF847_00500 [Bacteroidota bacterium]